MNGYANNNIPYSCLTRYQQFNILCDEIAKVLGQLEKPIIWQSSGDNLYQWTKWKDGTRPVNNVSDQLIWQSTNQSTAPCEIAHPVWLRTLGSGAPKYILDRWMLMVMSVFFFFEEEDGGAWWRRWWFFVMAMALAADFTCRAAMIPTGGVLRSLTVAVGCVGGHSP